MTAVKHLEHQITRQLMRRREVRAVQQGAAQQRKLQSPASKWVDRLIAILALTTGFLVLGSYLEELLWAVIAATALLTLR
jgi:hypothetical protein